MSDKIIQLNEDLIKHDLKDLVRSSVEETLNALLDKEADELVNAENMSAPLTARIPLRPLQAKSPYYRRGSLSSTIQLRTSEHRSMYSYVRLSFDRCTATLRLSIDRCHTYV